VITKDGYLQHVDYVNASQTTWSTQVADTLPRKRSLEDIARKKHVNSGNPTKITHFWPKDEPPEACIDRTNIATGDTLDDWKIQLADSLATHSFTKLTDNFYDGTTTISTKPPTFDPDSLRGWIMIYYDDRVDGGSRGLVYENEAIVGAYMRINPNLSKRNIKQAILHEGGHVFGLEDLYHDSLTDVSMMENPWIYDDYTEHDLTAGKFVTLRGTGNEWQDQNAYPGTYGDKKGSTTIYTIEHEDLFEPTDYNYEPSEK